MWKILERAKNEGRNVLTIEECFKIFKKYEIRAAKTIFVKNMKEALSAAKKIGYPVVLKISSRQILHKTDIGAVITNINSKSELVEGYAQIMRKVDKEKIDKIVVQKMIKNGMEIIIGGKEDYQFGKILMFGLGGIFSEILNDVVFRTVPLSKYEAEKMIKEIKNYKVLENYRGKSYDINSLIDILIKVSKLLEENEWIKELDMNPVIVLSKNAFVVDGRIIF
ncbi:MAG: acetate--CoA ligase family protein [Candidatus Aenigmatarchaeota archaeon]